MDVAMVPTIRTQTQGGPVYAYCLNCHNKIKVGSFTSQFKKWCFRCGYIVTDQGTFSSEELAAKHVSCV